MKNLSGSAKNWQLGNNRVDVIEKEEVKKVKYKKTDVKYKKELVKITENIIKVKESVDKLYVDNPTNELGSCAILLEEAKRLITKLN